MQQLTLLMYAKVAAWKLLMALAVCIAMAMLLCLFPPKALADDPVTITIIPDTATFPANEPTSATTAATYQIAVQVINNSQKTINNVTLCWLTNANIDISNVTSSGNAPSTTSTTTPTNNNCLAPLSSLASTAQYVWTLKLTQAGSLQDSSSILFSVAYQLSPTTNAKNKAPEQYVFKEFTFKTTQPASGDQFAVLSVLSSPGTVNDQQTEQIFLKIQNNSRFELAITKLIMKHPDYIVLSPNDFKSDGTPVNPKAMVVEPGEELTSAINITTNGPVSTGKQTLVFQAVVQWRDNGQKFTGNLVTDTQVDVGVIGSSEILQILELPTMLFLPGFLIVITLLVLKKGIESPLNKWIPDMGVKPDFWLAAITLSILMDIGYFLVTQHKFWAQYDLQDIVVIWLFSLLIAVLGYFLVLGIDLLKNALESEWLKEHTPDLNDTPVESLRKLERQKLHLVRDYVRLKIDGEVKRVFLLEPRDKARASGQTHCWVTPAICLQWRVCNDPELMEEKQKRFNDILKENNAGEMATFLEAWDASFHDKMPDNARENSRQAAQNNHHSAQDGQNSNQQTQDARPVPVAVASAHNGQAQNNQSADNQAQNPATQNTQAQNGNAQGNQPPANHPQNGTTRNGQIPADDVPQAYNGQQEECSLATVVWRTLHTTKNQIQINGPFYAECANIIFDPDQQFIIEQDFTTAPD